MGRKRKPDTLTITVTRKHGAKLISKTKLTDELRGDIKDIEEAVKNTILVFNQPTTTQTNDNGTGTEVITYTAPAA